MTEPTTSPRFTPEERHRVRERVFEIARADDRITGGAITGSRAVGLEDAWSDIDTAFGIRPGSSADEILTDWTEVRSQPWRPQGHRRPSHSSRDSPAHPGA